MHAATPPDLDEIEISVFGPGRGECVVVHLGKDEWCVVDSCIPKGQSEPIALKYLKSLGQSALAGVKLIVATHWHDDHIRGLAALLKACEAAQFCCSIALKDDQFFTLVAKETSAPLGDGSGVREFAEIFQLLKGRSAANMPHSHVSPIMAGVNRRLIHLSSTGRPFDASITALSPSDGLFRQSLSDFQRWTDPKLDRTSGRPQNDTSVVLWIEAGERRVLLGADLEIKTHAGAGWLAAINSFQGQNKASFYKVAHHGSPNGDCDEIWSHLLEQDSHAVVTPYNASSLPDTEDIQRLKNRTKNLFLTARPTSRLPKRDSLVEKELRRVNRRVIDLRPGHVRWRWKKDSPEPSVELFEGAESLS